MDPTVAPPHPPPSATTNYRHSNASNTDSWGEDNSLYSSNHGSSASIKLRLMCSNGGHIVPRPHDKSLCYVGGETRMVVVDRHTTLLDLIHQVSKNLLRSSSSSAASFTAPSSFTLKYQLPSEDLDSLISLTTDEDLENMIEEYERLNSSSAASKTSRLRLFLFPTKPEPVSSIIPFLENSSKSEDWFLNALNGSNSGFSDTSSVNCLLGLEDETSLPEKKDVNHKSFIATNPKVNDSVQDVQSIPDSTMMETTSSFGSASSSPSLANLPPIKVNVDDYPNVVGGGIEEQFSQMSVQQRHHQNQDEAVVVSGSPMTSATPIREHSDPFLSYNESSGQGLQMAYQMHRQQKQSTGFDQNTRNQMQQQKHQNSARLSSMPITQIDRQHPQLHHHQVQFIQAVIPPPPYIHHHHPAGAVPAASYYQMYPAMDPQNFVYRTTNSGAPQLIRVPSSHQHQPQYVHNPSQPVVSSVFGGGGNYGDDFTDSLRRGQQRY